MALLDPNGPGSLNRMGFKNVHECPQMSKNVKDIFKKYLIIVQKTSEKISKNIEKTTKQRLKNVANRQKTIKKGLKNVPKTTENIQIACKSHSKVYRWFAVRWRQNNTWRCRFCILPYNCIMSGNHGNF